MGWESTEQRVLLLTEQHWQEKLLLLSVAGRKRSSSQPGSSGDRGNSHYIAMLQLLQEPSVQRDGEGAQHSIRCPWELAEQTSACGRQQSCPHLFPSTPFWARLSLYAISSGLPVSLHCWSLLSVSDHKLFPLHVPEALWTVSIVVQTSGETEYEKQYHDHKQLSKSLECPKNHFIFTRKQLSYWENPLGEPTWCQVQIM